MSRCSHYCHDCTWFPGLGKEGEGAFLGPLQREDHKMASLETDTVPNVAFPFLSLIPGDRDVNTTILSLGCL